MLSKFSVGGCVLMATAFVLHCGECVAIMPGDIAGPAVLDYGDPCSLYRCPPNFNCLVGFKPVGHFNAFPRLVPRAICRPDQDHGCTESLCSDDKMCLSMKRACANQDPKPAWCEKGYMCVNENDWYNGYRPIKPGMYEQ